MRWMAGVLVMTLAGCATVPVPPRAGYPHPLSEELARYYDYPKVQIKSTVVASEEKSGYRIQHLTLSPEGTADSQPIRVDWYQSRRPGRQPAVLMSPILADNDLYVREFARFYAPRGMHTLIVYRAKEVFSEDRPLKDVETHFRQSIIQIRQTIDWLENQESIDINRIGSYGISLGAILTSILTAVEPRVKVHILGLPAGHLAQIIMTSKDKAIGKHRNSYLKRHGLSQEEALRQLTQVILSEPLRFAPAVDPRRVLVIVALFDRVLGVGRSIELWRAMGRPPLILLPTGHYTAYFATAYLKVVTYSFLRRGLCLSSNSSRRSAE